MIRRSHNVLWLCWDRVEQAFRPETNDILQTEKKEFVEEIKSAGAEVTVVDGKSIAELAELLRGGLTSPGRACNKLHE